MEALSENPIPTDEQLYNEPALFCCQKEADRAYIVEENGFIYYHNELERTPPEWRLLDKKHKEYYLNSLKNDFLNTNDVNRLHDEVAIFSNLADDLDQRMEFEINRHGTDPVYIPRAAKGTRCTATYTTHMAREKVNGANFTFPVIETLNEVESITEIAEQKSLKLLNSLIEGKMIAKILEVWLAEPLNKERVEKMCIVDTQRLLYDVLPAERRIALQGNYPILLPDISEQILSNEMIELPTWVTQQYHLMRVKNDLTLVMSEGQIAVQENNSTRILKVQHSRYDHHPLPVTMYNTPDIFHGSQVEIEPLHLPMRLPSVNSVSGMSTVTMSTATTSPGSWIQNWTLHAIHEDQEFRAGDCNMINPKQLQQAGEYEFRTEMSIENQKRVDALVRDVNELRKELEIDTLYDIVNTSFDDIHNIRPNREEAKWVMEIQNRLDALFEKAAYYSLEVEEEMELITLSQVRERYDSKFSCYFNDRHPSETNLAFNDTWSNNIMMDRIDENTVNFLSRHLSDRHVWVPSPDSTNQDLVDRCDIIQREERLFGFQKHELQMGLFLLFSCLFVAISYILTVI